MIASSHPILTCEAARALEAGLFAGDESKEWAAMQRAGRAIAAAVLRDFEEIGGFPPNGRVLVLVGKGHNGGDALIAAQAIWTRHPQAGIQVVFAFGPRVMRPLAARAWLEASGCGFELKTAEQLAAENPSSRFDVCLDGVFGFQFRPPAEPRVAALLETVNRLPVRLRAAVDLPSARLFQADFTYATGSIKTPVLEAPEAGRVRYLDLGFFTAPTPGDDRVLTAGVLAPLAALRDPRTDKRTFGHVFVVGGSRSFPGAVLMTVLATLRSGAGLVTAFVPESIAPSFAARAPEAMWVGCPESPHGGLALEGEHLVRERLERATALVVGPGMGREPETLALAGSLAQTSPVPLVLDADALQRDIVGRGRAARIVTPHAGEFARIAGGRELRDFARETGLTVVLKGPVTKVCSGATVMPTAAERPPGEPAAGLCPAVYHSFFGGPVLARGGSGDVLAGLIGGLLAQKPTEPVLAAARGVVWHGLAAEALARSHGQVAVSVTQLLDFLPAALRESEHEQ